MDVDVTTSYSEFICRGVILTLGVRECAWMNSWTGTAFSRLRNDDASHSIFW